MRCRCKRPKRGALVDGAKAVVSFSSEGWSCDEAPFKQWWFADLPPLEEKKRAEDEVDSEEEYDRHLAECLEQFVVSS